MTIFGQCHNVLNNKLRYLSADIICSEKRTVLRERSSRKTVSFEEQIMSKDKYLSIFLKSNGDYRVYYPSNIFRNMRESSGSAILSYVNHVKVCQLAYKISTSARQISLQSKAFVWGKGKTFQRKINLFNSVKDKSKIQVADKVTGNLTTSREQAKDH